MDKGSSEEFWRNFDRRKSPHEYEIFNRVKELLMEFTEQERIALLDIKKELHDLKEDVTKLKSQQETIMEMYIQSKGIVRFIGWMAIVVSMGAAVIDYVSTHIRFLKQ